jgi:hypothetical protein
MYIQIHIEIYKYILNISIQIIPFRLLAFFHCEDELLVLYKSLLTVQKM